MSDKIFYTEKVREWLAAIKDGEAQVLSMQKSLALVEAPTFEETVRGEEIKDFFCQIGLADVAMDEVGNVYGTHLGEAQGDNIVIEAHMDTVFPKGTAKEVREENGVYYCPGISDNTRGIAVLYGLVRIFQNYDIKTKKNIVFLATVREEGIGGCSGLKYFLEHCSNVDSCISIDGPDADVIIHGGCGIKTIEVQFSGRGGHAYKAYGQVGNPAHAAIRAMDKIIALQLKADPKTTCVVSGFHAGTTESVHAIPAEATLTLNFRSADHDELQLLEQEIMKALEGGVSEENAFAEKADITYTVACLVDVPAVQQPASSQIVETMASVMEYLQLTPILDSNCPTNANITIGKGIPGICIGGGGKAGDNHSLLEWYDSKDSYLGVQGAFLALLALAEVQLV